MLTSLGLLRYDGAIAFLIRVVATLSLLAAVAGAAWLIWRMLRDSSAKAAKD